MRNRHSESGFSLFETLVVISISFVALTSIFYIGRSVQVKNQAAGTERLLTTLLTEATSHDKTSHQSHSTGATGRPHYRLGIPRTNEEPSG